MPNDEAQGDKGPLNINPSAMTPADWISVFRRQSPTFGAADIFAFGPERDASRASSFAFAVGLLQNGDETLLASQIVVVLPPSHPIKDDVFRERVASWSDDPPSIAESVRSIVDVRRARDFDASSLAEALAHLKRRSVVLVVDAGSYRDSKVERVRRFDEDLWVPQVVETARRSVQIAQEQEAYILLDVGHFQPEARRNQELLLSVDRCGVMTGTRSTREETAWVEHVEAWELLLENGDFEAVAAGIEALPDLSRADKAHIFAQLLVRGGKAKLAFTLLRHQGAYSSLPTHQQERIFLMHVAAEAGEYSVATEVASGIDLDALHADELQSLVALSLKGLVRLDISRAQQLLEKQLPNSPMLTSARIRDAFRTRQFSALAELARTSTSALSTDEQEFFETVAARFSEEPPNYAGLLHDAQERWPDLVGRARLRAVVMPCCEMISKPPFAWRLTNRRSASSRAIASTFPSKLFVDSPFVARAARSRSMPRS